jgi:hypothetical protein
MSFNSLIEMSESKRAFIKSVFLVKSQDQHRKAERKVKNTEDYVLADRLLSEIKLLVFRQKNGYIARNHAMSKYTEDSIPFYLLSNDSRLVRKFASILICLIFEEKSDLFRYKLHKKLKNACIENNKLFLSPKSEAIKNFRPEPLYHVINPFLYYLPNSSFPNGLTCYLDADKLNNILLLKEWMRLPDPQEHLIWMNFGESSALINFDDEESIAQLEDSFSYEKSAIFNKEVLKPPDMMRRGNPGMQDSAKVTSKARQEQHRPSIGFGIDDENVQRRNSQTMQSIDSIEGDASGVHRIKCFQFFRKQKTAEVPEEIAVFKELLEMEINNISEEPGSKGSVYQKLESVLARQYTSAKQPSQRKSIRRDFGRDGGDQSQSRPPRPQSTKHAQGTEPAEAPPQFESVNDWATDKDYSFYSTQMKFLPVKRSLEKKSKLKEVVQKASEQEKAFKSKHEKLMHDLVATLTLKQLMGKSSPEVQKNDHFAVKPESEIPKKQLSNMVGSKFMKPSVNSQNSAHIKDLVPELLRKNQPSNHRGTPKNHSAKLSSPQASFRIKKAQISPKVHDSSRLAPSPVVRFSRDGINSSSPRPTLAGSSGDASASFGGVKQRKQFKNVMGAIFDMKRSSAPLADHR